MPYLASPGYGVNVSGAATNTAMGGGVNIPGLGYVYDPETITAYTGILNAGYSHEEAGAILAWEKNKYESDLAVTKESSDRDYQVALQNLALRRQELANSSAVNRADAAARVQGAEMDLQAAKYAADTAATASAASDAVKLKIATMELAQRARETEATLAANPGKWVEQAYYKRGLQAPTPAASQATTPQATYPAQTAAVPAATAWNRYKATAPSAAVVAENTSAPELVTATPTGAAITPINRYQASLARRRGVPMAAAGAVLRRPYRGYTGPPVGATQELGGEYGYLGGPGGLGGLAKPGTPPELAPPQLTLAETGTQPRGWGGAGAVNAAAEYSARTRTPYLGAGGYWPGVGQSRFGASVTPGQAAALGGEAGQQGTEGDLYANQPWLRYINEGKRPAAFQGWEGGNTRTSALDYSMIAPHTVNYSNFLQLDPDEQAMAFAAWRETFNLTPEAALALMQRSAPIGTAGAGVHWG
jgi:hypothetical protein